MQQRKTFGANSLVFAGGVNHETRRSMGYRPRIQMPGLVRHLVARGNGRMRIFIDDADYRLFTFFLGEVVEEYDIECWNYCIMPNHYHLTLCPRRPNLSNAIRQLNSKYAQAWNRRHQRVGHVFQGRFKDQLVQNSGYLLALCRYVALNPVRANLVSKPEDWPWGSYPSIMGLKECHGFLSPAATLRLFGSGDPDELRTRFSTFVMTPAVDETPYDRLRSRERIVGDRAFKQHVASFAKVMSNIPEVSIAGTVAPPQLAGS